MEKETEITEEMIEAGVDALSGYDPDAGDDPRIFVVAVYCAMSELEAPR